MTIERTIIDNFHETKDLRQNCILSKIAREILLIISQKLPSASILNVPGIFLKLLRLVDFEISRNFQPLLKVSSKFPERDFEMPEASKYY